MTSLAYVEAELLPFVETMRGLELNSETLPMVRRLAIDAAGALQEESTDAVDQREIYIERAHGAPLRLVCYRPRDLHEASPAVLHAHGGGFVFGLPEMEHAGNVDLALSLRCVVISVDYRLAPEHPFPAALDDALLAFEWMHDAGIRHLGIDPSRIALAGESAGGGLIASLAQRLRDEGLPMPVLQLLSAPMLDPGNGNYDPNVGEFVWTRESNAFAWSAVGGETAGHRYFAAAQADNLANLPPAFIGVGALDLFVDEASTYAAALRRASVSVELHIFPGAVHFFHSVRAAPSAQSMRNLSLQALARAFGTVASPIAHR